MRRCLLALSVLLAAVVVPVTLASPAAAATPLTYVALGDSYAAGPFIPAQTGTPTGCLRSDRNYPSLVARALGAARDVRLRDVSCSGATTEHLRAPQRTELGTNPPQLDALGPGVGLVSVTVGGNDIGFGEIVRECATRSPLHPFSSACRDHYTAGGTDQLAARIDAAAPKIAAALAAVAQRAPRARVLLVGYPAILPDEGPGCFPVVPFTAGDVAYLRQTEKRLDAMLEREAQRAGADYVDTYAPTIGHDVCQRIGTKWIEGIIPTSPAAPVHPNAQGMAAMALAVGAELGLPDQQPAA